MKDLEREFERMVMENRGTIYTVCYMFFNDQDMLRRRIAKLGPFDRAIILLWTVWLLYDVYHGIDIPYPHSAD